VWRTFTNWLKYQWLLWLATSRDPTVRAWAWDELEKISAQRARIEVAELCRIVQQCRELGMDEAAQLFVDYWIAEKMAIIENYVRG
jgi:hypothetical protein